MECSCFRPTAGDKLKMIPHCVQGVGFGARQSKEERNNDLAILSSLAFGIIIEKKNKDFPRTSTLTWANINGHPPSYDYFGFLQKYCWE